ncbi:hypothetical protein B0T09DRAFT_340034 [Sordaria sp. MPI-SDFR-AT-0083]|nr:hypothetical protein B0T09DRAFT_340034 [Sordaria sp. MPI-SDFR-AT-0083]
MPGRGSASSLCCLFSSLFLCFLYFVELPRAISPSSWWLRSEKDAWYRLFLLGEGRYWLVYFEGAVRKTKTRLGWRRESE